MVYSLDNRVYDVKSVTYCNETFQVCLNVLMRNNSKSEILVLNETFKFIKSIDHNLLNPQFSLSYTSNIIIFDIDYYVFNYNANIAILQEKCRWWNVYFFDKSNYTIIDVIDQNTRIIIGSWEERFYQSNLKSILIIII